VQVVEAGQHRAQYLNAAVEVVQAGAAESGAGVALQLASPGRSSSRTKVLHSRKSPKGVNRWPLRALRVRITQSNMSTPGASPSTKFSGAPIPNR
jgi:hypothetical protein